MTQLRLVGNRVDCAARPKRLYRVRPVLTNFHKMFVSSTYFNRTESRECQHPKWGIILCEAFYRTLHHEYYYNAVVKT
jgi:hypothetical protein